MSRIHVLWPKNISGCAPFYLMGATGAGYKTIGKERTIKTASHEGYPRLS